MCHTVVPEFHFNNNLAYKTSLHFQIKLIFFYYATIRLCHKELENHSFLIIKDHSQQGVFIEIDLIQNITIILIFKFYVFICNLKSCIFVLL